MIKTITELTSEGVFETFSSLSNVKTNNPSPGDIYYDTTKNRICVFDGGFWKELKVSGKNALFNRERMRKIKNIFKEK